MGTESPIKRPDVFTYSDASTFLRDWIVYLKSSDSSFSLRKLAQSAAIASGYMPMFLAGKRSLSARAFQKIAPYLKLKKSELNFLGPLIAMSGSGESSEKLRALRRIQRFRSYSKKNENESVAYEYLTNWYYVAIRELVMLTDFQENATWIQTRLQGRVTLQEVKQALDFLMLNKFVLRDKGGKLIVAEKSVSCVDGIFKLSLSEFHRQMLGLAAESIEKVPRTQRFLNGHTMAFSSGQIEEVSRILIDALDQIELLAEKNPSEHDSVYHVELAAFPLSVIHASSIPKGNGENLS